MFEDKFGHPPSIETINISILNSNITMSNLESLSFYFLNVIKNKEKEKFYTNKSLKERINWIYNEYEKAAKHAENPSLVINFFDLDIAGVPKDHMMSTLLILIGCLILFIAYKYQIIKIN